MAPISAQHFADLVQHARQADEQSVWPAASWRVVQELGATRWAIPAAYGGAGISGIDLLKCYESLAGACLTSCFLLSQRDAACRRLLSSGNELLCRELLPGAARGERFITVGLAQLTTSRQHTKPALFGRETVDGFVLDGAIPWVTGAAQASHLVIGAVTREGQQILAVLPTDIPGLMMGKPLELMALEGSLTSEVRCDGVLLPRRWLLLGPTENVLRGEKGGAGGLETSCLALGVAGAAVGALTEEARARAELAANAGRLEKTYQALRQELYRLAAQKVPPEAAQAMRAKANAFVLRATQAALAASKGSGFLRDHPAQRLARQALSSLSGPAPGQSPPQL